MSPRERKIVVEKDRKRKRRKEGRWKEGRKNIKIERERNRGINKGGNKDTKKSWCEEVKERQ